MNLVRQRPICRNVQKPTIIFAFWRRLQLPFSTTTSRVQDNNPAPDSYLSSASSVAYQSSEMVDYLIKSIGFPSEEATRACRRLGNCGRVQKAERIIAFFRECGFTDTRIRKTIIGRPILLQADPEKTLRPKITAILRLGLSVPELAHIVSSNPGILYASLEKKVLPVVGLLRTLFPDDKDFIRSIKSFFSRRSLGHDIDKKMAINLSFLRGLGVSDRSLLTLLLRRPTLFAMNPSRVETVTEKAHGLGFDYGSVMFTHAVFALSAMSESSWDAKLEVLKGFGWTQEDIMVAFQKAPFFLILSTSNLQQKLELFLGGLGYKPSELAAKSTILTFSTEKRVKPRLAVIKLLESKKLLKRKKKLGTILLMKNGVFYEEYVLKYKDECPDIFEAYNSSIKGDAAA